MLVNYDKLYQTKNLFGDPYPELIEFYSKIPKRGKLLDLGCGQGRNSIAIAKLGFDVVGIDHSKVGIEQLNKMSREKNLNLVGIVGNIYSYSDFKLFKFILIDSLFHFNKNEKEKECFLLETIIKKNNP